MSASTPSDRSTRGPSDPSTRVPGDPSARRFDRPDEAPNPDAPSDAGYALDELRAFTNAAGTRAQSIDDARHDVSDDDIVRVRTLHEATLDAARRTRRVLSTPNARRKLQDAIAEEAIALHGLGFASYEAFSATFEPAPTRDDANLSSDETLTRITALLAELGVDPSGDPIRAASEFLTTHEAAAGLAQPGTNAPADRGIVENWVEEYMRSTEAASAHDFDEPPVVEPETMSPEPVVLAGSIEPEPIPTGRVFEPAPVDAEAAPEVDAREDTRIEEAPDAHEELEATVAIDEVDLALETEADEPSVPAAQIPATQIPLPQVPSEAAPATPPDDDVVDRWVSAEARAERMHAEVDRAQAELVAMLARSADAEHTVVARVDELDAANSELAQMRRRVSELEASIDQMEQSHSELEQSIARTDGERSELERAIAASRDRVAHLEADVTEREAARADAIRERASALERLSELESTLASRTSDLVQARASVTELEAELVSRAARLAQSAGELGAARANAEELTAELESTRRALDALDAHAEAIEAELAEARRAADNPELRRELEVVREELASARSQLEAIADQRVETDRALSRDRAELQQLQDTLEATRQALVAAREELQTTRLAVDETLMEVEAAERAREAITLDAADVLARAEAQATAVLERANRDAEAIRQEAAFSNGARNYFDDATLRPIVEQVERLERKVAKQRRRLDRITRSGAGELDTGEPSAVRPDLAAIEPSAAEVIAAAEREAEEIRRAARRDGEHFREQLVDLVNRLAPPGTEDD